MLVSASPSENAESNSTTARSIAGSADRVCRLFDDVNTGPSRLMRDEAAERPEIPFVVERARELRWIVSIRTEEPVRRKTRHAQ